MKIPGRKPWALTTYRVVRRTVAQIRQERIDAGLCIYCGDKADRLPLKSCVGCGEMMKVKKEIKQ